MLKIKENDGVQRSTIEMNKMEPLQVGLIKGGGYNDLVVMRTASLDKFEVINLSESGENKCWNRNSTLNVELLPKGESITIELFN